MKKFLLLITTLLLAFTLAGCGLFGDDDDTDPIVDDGVTSVTIAGVVDQTIMVDDVFNVFTGVTAIASDDEDYASLVTADSDNCTIDPDGTLQTTIQAECIINYAVVVEGKIDSLVVNITIDKEVVVVDGDAPLVQGWTFDDDDALVGWTQYENGDGTVVGSIEDGALKLVVASGANIWEPRFEYMGLPLQQGVDYVVTFRAKALVDGKVLHLQFGALEASEFDAYFTDFKRGQTETVTLTTEWVDYTYSFTMILNNVNGGPLFEMGDYEGSMDVDTTIFLDDLEVRGGSSEDTIGPVLSGIDDITIYIGDAFDPLTGVTAIDFVEGDLTSEISLMGDVLDITTEGEYGVNYYVKDSENNFTMKIRYITVLEDVLGPELSGVDELVIPVGTDFNSATDVAALDNRDGDVTADIVITGDVVDTAVAGAYTITYTVEDALGNETVVDRLVVVNAMIFDPTDLLTNGTFDASNWTGWYGDEWSLVTTSSVTFVDGVMVVTVAGLTDGHAAYATQIFQENFAVENAKQYVISFDAYATDARPMNVNFGDALDGAPYFTNFMDTFVVALTDTVQTFTTTFTMAEDTTADQGKLVFELGTIGGVFVNTDVFIDNVMIQEFDGTDPVAETDQVLNGDMAVSDFDGWYTWARDWETVINQSVVIIGGVAEFTYDGIGDAVWNVQFGQGDVAFEYGQTYRISFDAKADAAKDFLVDIYDGGRDFVSPTLTLGTDWASYEYILTWDSEALGKLQFVFGLTGDAAGGVFFVDNVNIEILQQEELLLNGDFETSGWSSWMADWNSTSATFDYSGGEIVVDVADIGEENWNIQLFQEGMNFVNGQQYIITFDAMSTVDRDINVKLISASEFAQMVSLTSTMDTYTFIFTFTDPDGTGKLDFELGGAAGGIVVSAASVITFDNIMVEEYDGAAVVADTNQVVNGTLDQHLEWGTWYGDEWSGYTSSSASVVDGEIVVVVAGLEATHAAYATQVFQEGFTIRQAQTYVVEFDAYADVARQMNVNLGDALDADPYFINFMDTAVIDLTTETQHFMITFTMLLDTNEEGKLVFELGTIDGAFVNTTVHIDNIVIYPNYN